MHKKLIAFALAIPMLFSYCSLFTPSANKLYRRSIKKHAQYDAVIVPGVPFIEPEWDRVMLMRVIWAVHLYKRGITKNIIMSGGAVYSPYAESKIMKQYAIALGVPEQNIFVEDKAEHTTENVWYSYKIAKSNGFTNVALASDPYQTKLIYRFCRRRVRSLSFLPSIFDTLRTLSHETPKIEYKQFKIENFVALPDRESKWQRLRGTRGKHINFKEKD
ncbi:MAG TPA: YdcF family protein [Bacteroidia bacterium]|jgi:uncharacterized SAM-binding protein YcdF (DUF218 family)|nr:YdcF family protein [Bacteroidia bacterium]